MVGWFTVSGRNAGNVVKLSAAGGCGLSGPHSLVEGLVIKSDEKHSLSEKQGAHEQDPISEASGGCRCTNFCVCGTCTDSCAERSARFGAGSEGGLNWGSSEARLSPRG